MGKGIRGCQSGGRAPVPASPRAADPVEAVRCRGGPALLLASPAALPLRSRTFRSSAMARATSWVPAARAAAPCAASPGRPSASIFRGSSRFFAANCSASSQVTAACAGGFGREGQRREGAGGGRGAGGGSPPRAPARSACPRSWAAWGAWGAWPGGGAPLHRRGPPPSRWWGWWWWPSCPRLLSVEGEGGRARAARRGGARWARRRAWRGVHEAENPGKPPSPRETAAECPREA